jgi:hypothetical protein
MYVDVGAMARIDIDMVISIGAPYDTFAIRRSAGIIFPCPMRTLH